MSQTNTQEYNIDLYNFFALVAEDLNCTIKSLCNNYIFEIFSIDKNKKFYIIGNSLPLNNNTCQKICQDKSATSTVLTMNRVSCVEHILIKNPKILKIWDNSIFENLIKQYSTLVVKDNTGSGGEMVFKADNVKDFKKYANIIFNQNKDVAVSPFINYLCEYRLIMLNNKCEICFKKIKPFVVGDGKTSTLRLAEKKYGKENITKLNIQNKNYKPNPNETVFIGWKNNLKMLASVEEIENKSLEKKLKTLAKTCTKALGIKFCSVDIVEDEGILKVLEVNSVVSVLRYAQGNLNREKQVKTLFKKAFLQQLKS